MTRHHDHRLREIERRANKGRMPELDLTLRADSDESEREARAFAARQPQGPLRILVERVQGEADR